MAMPQLRGNIQEEASLKCRVSVPDTNIKDSPDTFNSFKRGNQHKCLPTPLLFLNLPLATAEEKRGYLFSYRPENVSLRLGN